jgi:hypothetical protein
VLHDAWYVVYHSPRRGEAFAHEFTLIGVASMLGILTCRDHVAAKRAAPLPL